MTYPAIESSVDAAYWFFDRAYDAHRELEDNKMQHLLFLSQLIFASAYNREMLVPALFVCDESGFFEPNIKKILAQGRPFMPHSKFNSRINEFLEEIWHKYASKTASELEKIVKDTHVYHENYHKERPTLLDFRMMTESLDRHGNMPHAGETAGGRSKVLLSQNGPVVVSPWQPRKVSQKTLTQGVKHV